MITQEINRATNLTNKKFNEILIRQLLPYVNNMIGFNIDVKIIINIINEISQKYNYLNEDNYNTIFTLLGINNEQIEIFKKEISFFKNKIISYI